MYIYTSVHLTLHSDVEMSIPGYVEHSVAVPSGASQYIFLRSLRYSLDVFSVCVC